MPSLGDIEKAVNKTVSSAEKDIDESTRPALAEIGAAKRTITTAREIAGYYSRVALAHVGSARSMVSAASSQSEGAANELRIPKIGVGLYGDTPREYQTKSDFIVVNDSSQDHYFLVRPVPGNYTGEAQEDELEVGAAIRPLPPSITFSITGNKNIVKSQIIDGPAMYERVNYEPKTVQCQVLFEHVNDGSIIAIGELNAVLTQLYENDNILQIVNPYLNSLGLFFGIISTISFRPQAGSKLNMLSFTILEVNTSTRVIY